MVLVLLLIPSGVLAEFTMGSSASSADVCSSETALIIVTTTNLGPNADTFNIGLSDKAAKWSVVAPQGFVLQPGETQNSYIYTTVPTGTKTGSYGLSASVSSNSEGQQTQNYIVNVGECNSVEITPVAAETNFCTCTANTYEFLVRNSGRWAENYRLSLAGSASEYATLSVGSISLQADEARSVSVTVAPACGDTGSYDLTLIAESMDSDAVESQTITLGVDGCYDFDFALAENYLSFCDNSEAKIPVTIQNQGTVRNGYTLDVDGPVWAGLDRARIEANAGTSEVSNLVLFPELGVLGNFPMTVTVTSDEGDDQMTESFTANVLSCRETSVELAQSSDTLCGGNSKSYQVSLVNAGQFDEKYALSLEGPSWAKLNTNFLSLDAGDSTTLDLEVSPEVSVVPGSYTFEVGAETQNIGSTSDSDTIEITISSRASCFGVQLESESTDLEIRHGMGELIPIVVNNIGASDASYELEISGDGANLAQLNPGVVELEGNSAETVYLHLSAPDDVTPRRYRVTVSARSVEDQTVTGSTTVAFNVIESETPSLPERTSEAGSDGNGTAGGILQSVSSTISSAASAAKGITVSALSYTKATVFRYWHIALIAVGALLLLIVILRFGIFKRQDDWFDDFEELFNEEGDFDPDRKTKKETKSKPKKKDKPKGPIGKFVAWLTEEDDFDDFDFDFEKPKKSKKAKKGAFSKFKDWLEEDDDFSFNDKPKKKAKAKPAKTKSKPAKKSKTGLKQKFIDWLYEDDEVPVKKTTKKAKPVKKAPKAKPKSKAAKKSAWGRFVDWLYEDDEEPVKKTTKKATRKPAKKTTRKTTTKRKTRKK